MIINIRSNPVVRATIALASRVSGNIKSSGNIVCKIENIIATTAP